MIASVVLLAMVIGAITVFIAIRKHNDRWRVVRTIWPYPDGYGVHNKHRNALSDAGLTKGHAEKIAKEMNDAKPN